MIMLAVSGAGRDVERRKKLAEGWARTGRPPAAREPKGGGVGGADRKAAPRGPDASDAASG